MACGHVHQYRDQMVDGQRHIWAPSAAYIIPDSRQPRYGVKEVGFVEHHFFADGRHDARFVQADAAPTLNIADFPGAYGPV